MRVAEAGRLPVPVRDDGRRWSTVHAERTVLGIVHNIASATRLLDLLSVFGGDGRIQVVFSCTGSSALDAGTAEFLTARGMLHLPWEEAVNLPFDLAIATSRGGDLHRIKAPLVFTPHGSGHNKTLGRQPGAFGLTDEWLVHDGRLIPSAIVLSHTEQLDRLAEGCPQALPIAHVLGDPVIDQLRAGLPFRETYRRALGLLPGQRLVVVSSTWGPDSVVGAPRSDALRRALAELPADEFRVVAAVHPNAWHGHGAWQIRTWLTPLLEAGLILPTPDTEFWKAALCAADFLIGDHGSLTFYGTALGIPTVLGAFRDAVVAPGSPMRRLGDLLPRLDPAEPLPAGLAHAAATQRDDPALAALRATVTSEPGESATLLRRLFHTWLALPEPPCPAPVRAIPVPYGSGAWRLPHLPALLVTATVHDGEDDGPVPRVVVRRFPSALQRTGGPHLTGAHLAADPDDPECRHPRSADVLLLPRERCPRAEDVKWSDFTARFPGCSLVAVEEADQGCAVLLADGTRLRARWTDRAEWVTFAVAASAVHAYAAGATGAGLPPRIAVHAGDHLPPALLEVAALP
ncbi:MULTISPECIES: hypothetical protein [unclassified Streptomyces]|uniref:hypothetical protein n=1 Tax=unclassified Streptomyces TaxID=2593676 RepID=UPI0038121C80